MTDFDKFESENKKFFDELYRKYPDIRATVYFLFNAGILWNQSQIKKNFANLLDKWSS